MTNGIQNYIANLSMYAAQSNVATNFSIKLLDTVMETATQASNKMIADMLQMAPQHLADAGEIGHLLDLYA